MRIIRPVFATSAAFSALSACSAAPPETQAPQAAPVITKALAQAAAPPPPPPAPEPLAGDWRDWPLSQGNWVYRTDARGSLALFGEPGSDATFMVRCDKNRGRLFLSRAGQVSGTGTQMTLRASSGLQSYPANNSGGPLPYVAISVDPADFMVDRIIFSRGRFAVETGGLQSLAVPIWPEFNRVVEDCRTSAP
ncbi:MAG: hypothetical protein AAGM33_05505 [Pseudomonadota bacterium]